MCFFFFFVRVTILLYCVVFLAESLLFFFPCLEVTVLKRSKLSRLGARGKKSNKQTKRPNEHRPALIRHFVSSHVCLCVCVFATRCTYHDVHEACRLMDMFVITENVMLLFLFVFFLSPSVFSPSIFFVWLLTAVFFLLFSSSLPSSLSHTLSSVSVLFLLSSPHLYFNTVLVFVPSPLLPLLVLPPISLLPPLPIAGNRKLVDCPQLLDVDDMVKMREPDWKCVYTYLQEFYRGLVTKGLVKTKNSS